MDHLFKTTENHRFKTGKFFLGLDDNNHEIGIATERHAITVAGSRSGKGAGQIIPNLLRWPHNAICIDPSGENAEASWKAREDLGQKIAVLDPFRVANVPERLRASCNLLGSISPDGLTAREDIRAIGDGLVRRDNPKNAQWDDAAVDLLAGVAAHVLTTAPPDHRTLLDVRAFLMQPDEPLKSLFEDMLNNPTCGGLARAGGVLGLRSLGSTGNGPEDSAIPGARSHSKWLDSEAMASIAAASSFDLSELKTGSLTVFLVLPPEYLKEHARFLRLFVRCALDSMTKGGKTGKKCLFLLDEFFSLGHLETIAVSAGLLPKNGVHLWPFVQDMGQITTLYGPEGAQTFFANSDAHVFFGNTDARTLDYISDRLGRKTTEDIGVPPPAMTPSAFEHLRGAASAPLMPPRPTPTIPHQKLGGMMMAGAFATDLIRNSFHADEVQAQARLRSMIDAADRQKQITDQNAMREYQHAMSARGEPRLTPDEVKLLVGKGEGDTVAKSMIVFAGDGAVFNLKLSPYFLPKPPILLSADEKHREEMVLKTRAEIARLAPILNQRHFDAVNNGGKYGKLLKPVLLSSLFVIPACLSGVIWFTGKNPGWIVLIGLLIAGLVVNILALAAESRINFKKKMKSYLQAHSAIITEYISLRFHGGYFELEEIESFGQAGKDMKSLDGDIAKTLEDIRESGDSVTSARITYNQSASA